MTKPRSGESASEAPKTLSPLRGLDMLEPQPPLAFANGYVLTPLRGRTRRRSPSKHLLFD
ncbi:MAG: hypothetical protein RID07_10065 [Lacipirellulaceae bacterium]